MLIARPAAPMTVTMDAVLTPSCPTIIKPRTTYRNILAADIRNLLTPTSIDVCPRNLPRSFSRISISFLPTIKMINDITILKTSFCREGANVSSNFSSVPGVRSEGSMVGTSGVSVHARSKLNEYI